MSNTSSFRFGYKMLSIHSYARDTTSIGRLQCVSKEREETIYTILRLKDIFATLFVRSDELDCTITNLSILCPVVFCDYD